MEGQKAYTEHCYIALWTSCVLWYTLHLVYFTNAYQREINNILDHTSSNQTDDDRELWRVLPHLRLDLHANTTDKCHTTPR